jgi:hypothetical protein
VTYIERMLAWSASGHGSLTSAAIWLAASQFVTIGKSFIERRLFEIEKIWRSSARAKTSPKECIVYLMVDLPDWVQYEDIHPANLPWIGGYLNPRTGQVRHFMRSSEGVSSSKAFQASKAYIADHLMKAWSAYRKAIYHKDSGRFPVSIRLFYEGNIELTRALHTIEDSYAPGHVTREEATGVIITVHIWDKKNRNAHENWPGHHALDDPKHPDSMEFFQMAIQTCAALIVLVLANLDQSRTSSRKTFQSRWTNTIVLSGRYS